MIIHECLDNIEIVHRDFREEQDNLLDTNKRDFLIWFSNGRKSKDDLWFVNIIENPRLAVSKVKTSNYLHKLKSQSYLHAMFYFYLYKSCMIGFY